MVKPGTRALGIAESYHASTSTIAGAIVTAAGRADGFSFATCTVGGLDATDAVLALWRELDREDIQYCLLGGVALAWFNILDLERIGDAIAVPTLAVTFEESDGLEDSIAQAFDGDAAAIRERRYAALPPRRRIALQDSEVFVRTVNPPDRDVRELLQAYTDDHARPEPLRVARMAARAADRWWDRSR